MRVSHSSIFSFETLRLGRPAPADFLKGVVVAVALLGLAEAGARLMLRSVGDSWAYWDETSAAKFEAYRQYSTAHSVDVLVIGDSTGAFDLDPKALASVLPEGTDVYNLASPGAFPLASRQTSVPLLEQSSPRPRLVVVSFSPASFETDFAARRFEDEILDSPYCQGVRFGPLSPRCFYLQWVLRALPYLRDANRLDERIRNAWEARGYLPPAATPKAPIGNESPAARSGALPPFDPRRVEILCEINRLARDQGCRLVVLVPPIQADERLVRHYVSEFERAAQSCDFTLLDRTRPAYLAGEHFTDGIHLNPEGAARFSQEVGRELRPLLDDVARIP
jgi:hypothetical protein